MTQQKTLKEIAFSQWKNSNFVSLSLMRTCYKELAEIVKEWLTQKQIQMEYEGRNQSIEALRQLLEELK